MENNNIVLIPMSKSKIGEKRNSSIQERILYTFHLEIFRVHKNQTDLVFIFDVAYHQIIYLTLVMRGVQSVKYLLQILAAHAHMFIFAPEIDE